MGQDESTCLGIKRDSKVSTNIKFSDLYAVEFINYGIIRGSNLPNAGRFLLGHNFEVCPFPLFFFFFSFNVLFSPSYRNNVWWHMFLIGADVSLHGAWFP